MGGLDGASGSLLAGVLAACFAAKKVQVETCIFKNAIRRTLNT
jgi:hypothetical protein